MAIYFGADHFVWAYQIGLLNDKQTGERLQKVGALVNTGDGSSRGLLKQA